MSAIETAQSLRIIKTACPHDCPDTCSMLATVEDGKLLRVAGNPENPYTRGNLCRKVAHYEERVYSPDRVLHPMRRVGKKGDGLPAVLAFIKFFSEVADYELDSPAHLLVVIDYHHLHRRPVCELHSVV